MKKARLPISRDIFLYIRAIHHGVLYPLNGFCDSRDYRSITNDMHLSTGEVWPLPVTLEVPDSDVAGIMRSSSVSLVYPKGRICAELTVSDVFKTDGDHHNRKVFGTTDIRHPGVTKELRRSRWRVGGRITAKDIGKPISIRFKTPKEAKKEIAERGWNTIVGFQTRNPIHRAHEYLQTAAMNVYDGVYVQPQIGWLKKGDFSIKAILGAYNIMLREYYNTQSVFFSTLELPMNYAGPREAVLHAIVRRNYGCTHFIIGRDHAGVHNFYSRYEAQELATSIKDLGIKILPLKSPFYCSKCGFVTTEKTCSHYPGKYIKQISGEQIRVLIKDLRFPPEYMMRKDISSYLIGLSKKGEAFVSDGPA